LSLILAKKKLLMNQGGQVDIIGVAVQSGAATHTRIDVDGNTLSGAQYDLGGSYYDTHGAFAFADEIIDGQDMVKIPAMYYRRAPITSGVHSGKEGWWVTDSPAEGFVLHPAFMKGGSPIDHFWIGKYQGVNDGGTKLGSFGGTTPLVSLNISQFKSRADARNVGGQSGWMMWSYYQLAVIQMLAMIETASTDSQAAIGQGRVTQSNAANVDASDVAQATYRGVVGLWGNVEQLIDGLSYANTTVNLWDRLGNKGWVSTALNTKPAPGFPVAMNDSSGAGFDFRDVFFAVATNTAEGSGTWRDLQALNSTSNRVASVSGRWNTGANGGLWYVESSYAVVSSNSGIGSRLAKEP
jgi:hypothetical protein